MGGTTSSIIFGITVLMAVGGLCWYFCAWWYERHLHDLRAQLRKTRHAATAHVRRARKQISQLRGELQSARETIQGLERQQHTSDGAARRSQHTLPAQRERT